MFIKKKCYSNVFLIQQVIIINHKLLIEFLKHTLPLLIRRPAHQNNSNLYIFFLCINKIENQHQIVFQSRGARKAPVTYHFYFGFDRFSKHWSSCFEMYHSPFGKYGPFWEISWGADIERWWKYRTEKKKHHPLKKTHQRIKVGISVQRRSARASSFSSKTFDYVQLFLNFAFIFPWLCFVVSRLRKILSFVWKLH